MNLVNDHNYINLHLLSTYVQGTTFSIISFFNFCKNSGNYNYSYAGVAMKK